MKNWAIVKAFYPYGQFQIPEPLFRVGMLFFYPLVLWLMYEIVAALFTRWFT